MTHLTPEDVKEARIYVRTIARFGLHDAGRRLLAEQKLLTLIDELIDRAYEQFKEDALVATECFLSDERPRWTSECFAHWNAQLDNPN